MVTPFLNWRHNGKYYIHNVKERQKFVQFLANGLPWRTLYSVYSRFKILYCKKITYARYDIDLKLHLNFHIYSTIIFLFQVFFKRRQKNFNVYTE